jgi:general stress protein 26
MTESGQHDTPTLSSLLDGVQYVMLTTRGPTGALTSRPLQLLELDRDGVLWFFTAASSGKVRDIGRDAAVSVTFAEPRSKMFVSVSGRAAIVEERERIERLWSIAQTIFFPGGRDDPELALLKVAPSSGRYWDGSESVLGTLIKFGKAALLGEAQDLGTSGRIG